MISKAFIILLNTPLLVWLPVIIIYHENCLAQISQWNMSCLISLSSGCKPVQLEAVGGREGRHLEGKREGQLERKGGRRRGRWRGRDRSSWRGREVVGGEERGAVGGEGR